MFPAKVCRHICRNKAQLSGVTKTDLTVYFLILLFLLVLFGFLFPPNLYVLLNNQCSNNHIRRATQKPTQLCMYTMATYAFRRAEWRTSTHGRYKPRASYCCLVPDSDIEMCEVSYHQEQASINALNKNISFCTALLPRCQKDPFPPHPLAWASCVRVFCANLIYFFETQHPYA